MNETMIENQTFDEIAVGDHASLVRTLALRDIELFAAMSGDVNPAHMDPAFAADDQFHKVIAHGMWGGALISTVLGTQLPGPGTIYLGQNLRFRRPVALGDTITVTVTAKEKQADKGIVVFDCRCTDQNGMEVISGVAEVMAPTTKVRRPRIELPEVSIQHHEHYRVLLARCEGLPPVRTAVIHPCDATSLAAAVEAAEAGLIEPVLVGPEVKIRKAAERAGFDIARFQLIDTPHSHAAAAMGAAMASRGEVAALMKGALHTDELMSAVLAADAKLRTERRVSHVYLMDVPAYPRPLLISDAAINIDPTLEEKADICQNAIDVAHVIGIAEPKVAILSAVETVNPKLRSTIDAAALCKMAQRGQITGGVLDGPLAFDNAINLKAAADKGIVSAVAGIADILIVPDIESGNMLAKQLTFMAGADSAGIVVGARVPIILTSRSDSTRTRIASCAIAVLIAAAKTSLAVAQIEAP